MDTRECQFRNINPKDTWRVRSSHINPNCDERSLSDASMQLLPRITVRISTVCNICWSFRLSYKRGDMEIWSGLLCFHATAIKSIPGRLNSGPVQGPGRHN